MGACQALGGPTWPLRVAGGTGVQQIKPGGRTCGKTCGRDGAAPTLPGCSRPRSLPLTSPRPCSLSWPSPAAFWDVKLAGATSVGLVALLLASEPVFQALKLLGAAYLVLLGVQSLRSALRRSPLPNAGPAVTHRARLSGFRAFRQGVVNDLANPKMAVFFASVLPQFAVQGHGMLSKLVLLGLVFAALTFAWLAFYAALVARAGLLLASGSRVRSAIDGVAGAALIGLGIRVVAEER